MSDFQGWSRSQSGRKWAAIFENSDQFGTRNWFKSGPGLEFDGVGQLFSQFLNPIFDRFDSRNKIFTRRGSIFEKSYCITSNERSFDVLSAKKKVWCYGWNRSFSNLSLKKIPQNWFAFLENLISNFNNS